MYGLYGGEGVDWRIPRIGTKTRAVRADNDAAYVVAASLATTTTIINAGAIVRVWAVNKNNCLLLHFAFVLFSAVRGDSVWGCVCASHKSVYIMRKRLKIHAYP